MTAWHLDDETARRYTQGALPADAASSVEAHLLACAHCRVLITAPAERLDRVWDGIADMVDAPVPGLFERLLHAVGVRQDTARLLGAAYSLSLSWFAAGALTLLFALLAARETTRWGLLGFLTIAPELPVAGVSLAYGRGGDPAYEIGRAAPYPTFKVMLIRALAVLAATAIPAVLLGLLMLGGTWELLAWMLPAIALTVLSLTLASWIDPMYAALGVSLVWMATVIGANARQPSLTIFGPTGQLTFLLIILASATLLALRRKELS